MVKDLKTLALYKDTVFNVFLLNGGRHGRLMVYSVLDPEVESASLVFVLV